MPEITRSSVLLPLPDGPSSATISPEATDSETASRTTVSSKATETSMTSTVVMTPPAASGPVSQGEA